MSGNQQIRGLGFIEAERIALITGYSDNHFLINRYPDNRFIIYYTRCTLGILRKNSYKFISFLCKTKPIFAIFHLNMRISQKQSQKQIQFKSNPYSCR